MENIILVSSIVLGTLTYWLISRWYVLPALEGLPLNRALMPLVIIHCFRYIGLAFLLPGVVSRGISSEFAVPAAYGDLLASILAIVSLIALRKRSSLAIRLVWIFNVVGTIDLLNALQLGLFKIRAGQLGGAHLVPSLIVPALFVSHFLIFRLLIKGKVAGKESE